MFYGYIANRRELLRYLPGAETEEDLMLRAWRRWGLELQARVLGEYAAAFRDGAETVLTGDALGLRPLYYSFDGRELRCAPRLEALGTGEIDETYVADYLATGTHAGERTPYRHIRRLLPGRTLVLRDGRLTQHRTWDLSRVRPLVLRDPREYEERFRSLLAEGVAATMDGVSGVWSELSGGLDSSSIVAMAGRPLPTLSIVYSRTRGADERKWIRAVREAFGLEGHEIDFDETPPFSELPESCAAPTPALAVAPLYRRYEELLSACGVRVLLSGEGGDHVLLANAPEPHHLADPFARGELRRGWNDVRRWTAASPDRRSALYRLFRNVLSPITDRALGRSLRDGERRGVPPWLRLRARAADAAAPGRDVGSQYFSELMRPVSLLGINRHRLARSFEFRCPLLHRPLVEFLHAIPWERKLHPQQDRFLQRRALKGILPEVVRRRGDKRGPEQAYADGLRGSPWLPLLTDRPQIVERGWVDGALWSQAVDQARFGRTHSLGHFLAAATLEIWLRTRANRLDQFDRVPEVPAGIHAPAAGTEVAFLPSS